MSWPIPSISILNSVMVVALKCSFKLHARLRKIYWSRGRNKDSWLAVLRFLSLSWFSATWTTSKKFRSSTVSSGMLRLSRLATTPSNLILTINSLQTLWIKSTSPGSNNALRSLHRECSILVCRASKLGWQIRWKNVWRSCLTLDSMKQHLWR